MNPKTRHFPYSNLLLITVFLLGIEVSSSARPKISYADYCGAVVPQHPTTGVYASSFQSFHIYSSHFTGGEKLFAAKPRDAPISSDSTAHFRFQSNHIHKTQSADIFQLGGSLSFQGPQFTVNMPLDGFYQSNSRPSIVHTSIYVSFELSGYWSESTGKICMVGTGSLHPVYGVSEKPLQLYAVFKLNFPKISNISTSLVSGTVECLDPIDNPSFFDKISVLAYAQNNYSYTEFPPSIRDSCSNLIVPKETLGFEGSSVGSYIPNLLNIPLKLELRNDCSDGNCYPFTSTNGLPLHFLNLNPISFSPEGKFHTLIGFSNSSSHRFNYLLQPGNTLVGEGFWDYEKNQMCLHACPVLANASVGDCTIGLTLWFPLVFSIKSRSTVMGHIWSEKTKSSPTYFSIKSFRNDRLMNLAPSMKYKYSVSNGAGLCDAIENSTSMGYRNRTFPDGSSRQDLSFSMSLYRGETTTANGHASPLSFGETVFVDSFVEMPLKSVDVTQWNVSYEISYSSYDKSSYTIRNDTQISAEGYYNSGNGLLCMVGCMYTSFYGLDKQVKIDDSMDCNVLIDIHFPPIDSKDGEHLNGTIRSTRGKLDPLYFEPLHVSSFKMYGAEAAKAVWRMDIEIIMVVMSLTFSCILIRSQILYAMKRRDVLLDISITMLAVMTLGYLIPLILNFEAVLVMLQNRHNSSLWGGEWMVVREVVVRVLTLVAFVLHLRLLHVAWSARSVSGRKELWVAEKRSLTVCLLLSFAAAAIAWFVHSMGQSKKWKWENLSSYAGCILDGFLFPQIMMNLFQKSQGKALSLQFYVGMTVVRIFPHFYDLYRAHNIQPHSESFYIYASSNVGLFSSSWDIIIPFAGILFAACIFMQQRFGGDCILPPRLRKQDGYMSIAELSL